MPIDLATAWEFFSSPQNLQKITPAEMGFIITSDNETSKTYAGQIITYKISPVLGIPLDWMTEITHVQEPNYFVDEQRFGPYTMWHHEHHFKAIPGGVEMTDIVYYKLPLGFLGEIAHQLFVKQQLAGIFSYRSRKLIELFGEMR